MFARPKLGIQGRLIARFAGTAFFVFVILYFWLDYQVDNSIEDLGQQRINNTLKGAENLFDSRYEVVESVLKSSALDPQILSSFRNKERGYLKGKFAYWKAYWEYMDIIIAVDTGRNVIARRNNDIYGDKIVINDAIDEAIRSNKIVTSTERVRLDFITKENSTLASQIPTQIIKQDPDLDYQTDKEQISDALCQVVVVPIADNNQTVVGAFIALDILNNDFWFVEQMRQDYNLTASVFNTDGVRVSTTTMNEEGERLLGTLIPAYVMEVIQGGTPYRGVSQAGDQKYLTLYKALTDRNGQTAGILAIGSPMTDFVQMQTRTRTTIFLSMIFALAVTIFIAIYTTSFLIHNINRLLAVMSEVELGNYDLRSQLQTGDELETLSKGLDSMLDRIVNLIHTEDDQQRMQSQIIDLLVHVSNASEGDLTTRAEVTTDELGSVADAFNVMLEEISDLINQVKSSGMQVSTSTNEILASSEQMATGADKQIMEINNTTSAVEEMSISMSQVSENADAAAQAAQRSQETAKTGGTAVHEAIDGMRRIRDKVQTTAKKIKGLGDRSLEIGEIVDVINDIAAQTNMLALNAAIEAARAGEHGRGFSVVADKVQDLAERSTAATKDIASLIKSIQNETNEAVIAMEEGTREVEEGTALADSAGQALLQIEDSATKTADLVQEISLAAKQQVRGIEGIVQAMESISMVTKQTSKGVNQTIDTIQQLAEMSNKLQSAISEFNIEE